MALRLKTYVQEIDPLSGVDQRLPMALLLFFQSLEQHHQVLLRRAMRER